MISGTYTVSALLLAMTAILFARDVISPIQQTLRVTGGKLGSSHRERIFPLETRGLAIPFFFAIGSGIGGVFAPRLFGALIGSGSRVNLLYGYLAGSVLMLGASIVDRLQESKPNGKAWKISRLLSRAEPQAQPPEAKHAPDVC